jgi:hypothetical protein
MKKTMTKSTLLFASIMALAAFAMPSMASAANWGPFNTNHTLNGYIYVSTGALYNTVSCSGSLGVHVRAPVASTLDITSASFSSCSVSIGQGVDCNVTATASGLPWTAIGTSTSDVRINVTDMTFTYSQKPGGPSCTLSGGVGHVSGTLTGGAWSAAAHKVTYASDPGLSVNFGSGPWPVQTSWGLTDSGVNPLTLT